MAEVSSVTTFVMAPVLPWPDEAHPADALAALDSVALYAAGEPQPCKIRKISSLGATVCCAAVRTAGGEVAVELATGQRPAGTVEWVAHGEAGIRFRQPIDMVALLNRKLVSQTAERRIMPRVELRCHVGLKWGANLAAATLRNISARGLQVEGQDLPVRETFVSLFIDGLVIPAGEVVWRKGELAGIELMEELSWSSIMPWIRDMSRKASN
jgi:hypothetical protein